MNTDEALCSQLHFAGAETAAVSGQCLGNAPSLRVVAGGEVCGADAETPDSRMRQARH